VPLGNLRKCAVTFHPFFSAQKSQCKGMTYAMCCRCLGSAIGIHYEMLPFASVRASGGAIFQDRA
jgi:hypothetical protein